MGNEISEAQRANIRLDHINGDLKEIKQALKENTHQLGKTREDVASLKTEIRIAGGLVLVVISSLIAYFIGYLW